MPRARASPARHRARTARTAPPKFFSAWFCPFAQRAWIALEAKGVEYEYVECTLYEHNAATKVALPLETKRRLNPGFVEVSPIGLVPALIHPEAGADAHESLTVVEYVDGAFPGAPLLPTDPGTRAHVRASVAFFDDKIRPQFYKVLMAQDAAAQAAAAAALVESWTALAARFCSLDEGPFFLGAQLGFFECAAVPWFIRLEPVLGHYRGVAVPPPGADPQWDRLHAWHDACIAHPAVAATLADRERLIGNYSGYASGKATSAVARSIQDAPVCNTSTPGTAVPASAPAAAAPHPLRDMGVALSIVAAAVGAWATAPRTSSAAELAALIGFATLVAALSVALALSVVRAGARAVAAVDRVLLASFGVFCFVAFFFEPYVVHLCGWEGLETEACLATLVGRLWNFYATSFDPIFLNLPLWLRIVCSLDLLLFGPFYALSLFTFATGRQTQRWYAAIALPFSGALLYSTVVYFAYEVLAEAHRASLAWVLVVNLPWVLAPCLLLARCA